MSTESGHIAGAGCARTRLARLAGVLLGALAAALLASPAALALTQRGHAAAFSFGSGGTGAGQLQGPLGVAVSEATGDVYVVDSANHRIDVFDGEGKFLEAWGWGVLDGAKKPERCTSTCLPGIAGYSKGQIGKAEAIAVDNSTNAADPSKGDVYVEASTSEEHPAIEKFRATGKPGESGNEPGEPLQRLAGSAGEEKFEELQGIAVDPNGDLLVYNGEEIRVMPSDGKKKELAVVSASTEGAARPGVAADTHGNYYVAHSSLGGEPPTTFAKLDSEGEPLIEELDGEESTGVAVDNSVGAEDPFEGDAFVANVTGVTVLSQSGSEIEQFGSTATEQVPALVHSSGIAVNAKSPTGLVYVADAAGDRIDVYELEQPGKPRIDELAAAKTTANSTELTAQINADGATTTYAFRYEPSGPVPGLKEPCTAPCTQAPIGTEESIGQAFGDRSGSQQVVGLEAGTTYHYLVVAKNGKGETVSAEQTFTTQLTGSGFTLADSRQWQLVSPLKRNGGSLEAITDEGGAIQASADGSAMAYVSSAPLEGAEGNRAPEFTQILSRRGSSAWSSSDIATKVDTAEGVKVGATSEYLLFNGDLSLGLLKPSGGTQFEHPPLAKEAAEKAREAAKKEEPEVPTERTMYLRDNGETCAAGPEGCYAPLLTPLNTANPFGGKVEFVSATPDLEHVVLESQVALTPGSVTGSNLYEWSRGEKKGQLGSLAPVDVLPGTETLAQEPELGRKGLYRQAITDKGQRVVWSSSANKIVQHLYMRDMRLHQTIQLDTVQAGVEKPGTEPAPSFQAASADGSRIFFTDYQRLTADATASPAALKADLYECEVLEKEEHLECRLTDLTVDAHAGESADVQGILPGTSEDGTTVYFVANGRLAEGAQAGRCHINSAQLGATCNLYVERYIEEEEHKGKWQTTLIGALGQGDEPDWKAGGLQPGTGVDLARVTSSVTADGRYIAFMSNRPLTGYNNRDISSGAADEEVFLYDAGTATSPARLSCVSCNPSGARPAGVFDTLESGEGQGLLVDRPKTWDERWLSGSVPGWTSYQLVQALYQSRYLSSGGRVFFNSAEALVPQDTNGKEDVYEYEPPGVGGCTESAPTFSVRSGGCVSLMSSGTSLHETAFLDASASGNDVFFTTTAPLAGRGEEAGFNVYDASVCGQPGTASCLPESSGGTTTPCASNPSADACRPGSSGQAGFGTPASESASANGNVPAQQVLSSKVVAKKPLTRAQKLALALKACKKNKQRNKRVACEKKARKQYGPIKKAKKAKKSSAGHSAGRRGARR
jgi:DNA-binding beta-propeller fold protein YncE